METSYWGANPPTDEYTMKGLVHEGKLHRIRRDNPPGRVKELLEPSERPPQRRKTAPHREQDTLLAMSNRSFMLHALQPKHTVIQSSTS
ncbi:hypothetical protein EPUS_07398 [Endocarpon pusillum Z07020]|uniref:Uncharacterized protein n=1 Tax=Endocarpon pusillum (strain Z07020 / HMAS-L-300199) TaxID=1263415 RepID=U1GUR4_ENDPU|nr:uncharacterized protein EPUS_07398 [Endocarpon pusillum Z07020]ERF76198.1 hypothetical protein EPUS_07398 [Endocarpon pusillum Z07020]